jgi:hypothetical protein
LNQLQHVAKMNRAVGVGQGVGDENFALHEASFPDFVGAANVAVAKADILTAREPTRPV